jgi:hypothetical protein
MNNKQIAIRDCIECKRGKNSIYGNPRYIFTFDDNTTVKTEANAGWVYGLSSCQSYENKRITFKYVIKRGKEIMTDFINDKELRLQKQEG